MKTSFILLAICLLVGTIAAENNRLLAGGSHLVQLNCPVVAGGLYVKKHCSYGAMIIGQGNCPNINDCSCDSRDGINEVTFISTGPGSNESPQMMSFAGQTYLATATGQGVFCFIQTSQVSIEQLKIMFP